MKNFKKLFIILTALGFFIPAILSAQMTWNCVTDSAGWVPRGGHSSVVFDNGIWVIGGATGSPNFWIFLNDVNCSTDGGVNWSQITEAAPWSPRAFHTSVVFDNKMWVIGGDIEGPVSQAYNDVWYSTDGNDWTCATESAPWRIRAGHTSVVYNNEIWVIGGVWVSGIHVGYLNDVWHSADGVNWTCATDSAPWVKRGVHTSVVYDNKMWVIGGYYYTPGPGTILLNDVWWSTDGVNWTQATDSTPWLPRPSHESVVFDGKMWVMGGLMDWTLNSLQDVWWSTNGADWFLATDSAEWGRRYHLGGLVYDNKILVIGGWRYYETAEDDVWSSTGIGIEERKMPNAECVIPNATIVRGVLILPPASSIMRRASSVLLDITGREVMDLCSGANDIHHLSPGVYFVRQNVNNQTRKVVIMR